MARNLQEIIPAFFVGPNGQPLTPEQARTRQELAESLLAKATDTSPTAGGWTSVLAKSVQGLAAGRQRHQADEGLRLAGEEASRIAKDLEGPLATLLGGGAPAASSLPLGAAPVGAVASQPLDAISQRVSDAHQPVDLSGDKQAFIESLLPAAIEESRRTGVDPRIIVAQAAQETGWGRSAPGNNFFGIKSHGQGGGQNLATTEYINGKPVKITDSFRQFASPADSVRGYGDFILQNPRYKPLREAQGLDAQLAALGASGYATDPNYANSVGAIARSIPLPDLGAQEAPVMAYAPNGTPQAGALASAPFESAGLPQAPADPVIVATTPEEVLAAEMATGMVPNPLDMPENQMTFDYAPAQGGDYVDPLVSPQSTLAPAAPVGGLSGQVPANNPGIWGGGMDPNDPSTIPAMAGGTRDILPAGSPGIFPAAPGAIAQAAAPSPSPQGGGAPVGGGLHPAIVQALSSPYASPQTRQIAGMLLQQQMQAQDPYRQAQLAQIQAQTQKLQREATDPNSGETFFGNPVAIQNPDGTIGYGQIGNKGTFRPIQLGEGQTFAPPTKTINTGTEQIIVDQAGNVISRVPIDNRTPEKEKVLGRAEGEAQVAAPGDIQAGMTALDILDQIENHPGIEYGTGATSIANRIPGTSGYDFQNLVEQAKSGAFLTAIQQLRGLGSLSNAEGSTATAAVTRMDTATSKEAFLAALRDYRKVIQQGIDRARSKLPAPNDDAAPAEASDGIPTVNSQEEYSRIPSGTRYRAPDGTIRTKP